MYCTKVSRHDTQHKLALKVNAQRHGFVVETLAQVLKQFAERSSKFKIQNVYWYTKWISARIKVLLVFVLSYYITCNTICRIKSNLLTRSLRGTRYFIKYFKYFQNSIKFVVGNMPRFSE